MSKSLKILMAADDFLPNPGGIANHVYHVSNALAKRGHKIDLWAGHNEKHSEADVDLQLHSGVNVLRNKPFKWSIPGYLRVSWDTIRNLPKYLKQKEYDLVHWHSYFFESGAIRIAARNKTRVFTNHSTGFHKTVANPILKQVLVKPILFSARTVVTPSTELKQKTVNAGYPEQKVFCIPNGVDPEVFERQAEDAQLKKKLGIPEGHLVLMTPRRLVHKNGIDILINALGTIKESLGKTVLLIAGEGEEEDNLKRQARELGVADKVKFIGNQPYSEMPRVLSLCDIGILPSRFEAICLAGLEMMACKMPLVGTNIGGLPEFISVPDCGRIVKPEDPEDMGKAIKELIEMDPEKRKKMGEDCRQLVMENYTWDVNAQKLESVYLGVLNAN